MRYSKLLNMLLGLCACTIFGQQSSFAASPLLATKIDLESPHAFDMITSAARPDLKNLFERYRNAGLTSDFYLTSKKFVIPDMQFSRFTGASFPSDPTSCDGPICADQTLFEKARNESRSGRLILVTHGFNGFLAAAIKSLPTVNELKAEFPNVDMNKSILLITPKMDQSVFEHEMKHATDAETNALAELNDFLQRLIDSREIPPISARAINDFVWEIRAYSVERDFVDSHTRETEFLAQDSDQPGSFRVQLRKATSDDFKTYKFNDIDFKVKSYLLRAMRALNDPNLAPDSRVELSLLLKKYLPAQGPYTFEKLIGSTSR